MNTLFLSIGGILSQFFIFKYILIRKIRLNEIQFKILYNLTKQNNKSFILNEEFNYDSNHLPSIFSGIFKLNGLSLLYISKEERINQAGWSSTSYICDVYIFRWRFKKFKNFICDNISKELMFINVSINNRWIGEIPVDKNINIRKIYEDIEYDFKSIEKNKIQITSFLLYGEPGNGKTTFIRDIARKYGWNIHYFDITSEMTNEDILSLPSLLSDKTIVLLEDFDSVFDKRENIKYKGNLNIKFSFDAILNMLDGIFSRKNKIVFAMTCNDISKIDDSIINRRSRMKHKLKINNPSYSEILSIFNDIELADITLGLSLDNIYNIHQNILEFGKEKAFEILKSREIIN